ncbi:aconitase X [Methanothermococcus okinawensis]|nr:aconitase X catalytic domain-containing protein [Methanothermococcus okinawensis]
MFLTKEEEKIYNGEYGEVLETCMNLLVSLGDIYGAEKLIPISSAQVSGVSYKTIGEKGLEFLKDISSSNVKVSVPTTLNPAGMDLTNYEKLGFPKKFAKKQLEIIKCFKRMDIELGCTCTPYLSGNVPLFGSHISWAESSAVAYANSVIGARTNREGGPSALASAIIGKTPYYGYHLDENRLPTHIVEVEANITKSSDYGALGSIVGRIVKNGVPYFKFKKLDINNVSSYKSYKLKALGAALAASGGVALYHIENITPEANIVLKRIEKIEGNNCNIEKITITEDDIKNEYESLNSAECPDLICIGCPHCSLEEIKEVVDFILKNNLNKNNKFKCDLWICTSIYIKSISDRMGYTEIIENAGGKIVCDTCMVVAPIEDMDYKNIATNSGKAAKYLPNFCNSNVIYGDIIEILKKGL